MSNTSKGNPPIQLIHGVYLALTTALNIYTCACFQCSKKLSLYVLKDRH